MNVRSFIITFINTIICFCKLRRAWGFALTLPLMAECVLINETLAAPQINPNHQAAIHFLPNQSQYELGAYLELFEDKTGTLSFDDILQGDPAITFYKSTQEAPFFGYTDSTVWVRFYFTPGFQSNSPWYLSIGASALGNVELFEPNEDAQTIQLSSLIDESNAILQPTTNSPTTHSTATHSIATHYNHLISGLDHPLRIRNVVDADIAFKVSNIIPKKYYYLKINTSTNLVIPLRLMNQDRFNAAHIAKGNAFGFYYGGVVILIIYNLFFYLFNRSKDLIIYVAYLTSMCSYQLIVDGLALRYIWPTAPELNQLQSQTMFMVVFFCSQFGRSFLRLEINWPLGDALLRAISYIAIFLFCLSWFLPLRIMNPLNTPMGLSVTLLLLTSGIYTWIRGYHPARFFVIAWAMLVLGSFLILGRNLYLLPNIPLTQYGLHFGTLLEAVFLSFALADRINEIKREKDRVEREAKHELEHSNKILRSNAIKLRLTMEELKKSNRLKDDFLLSISHELRTPINGIQGSLNLLKLSKMEHQQSEYISIAQHSTSDLLTLIESILELNSLNQGMIVIREEKLNLVELLDDCIKSAHPLCKEKHITIDMVNLSLPEIVFTDRERLQHVIMNILNNSVKFTETGSISISSLVSMKQDNICDFELLIKDTGIGIAPEKLQSVFDAFTQADSGYTRRHGGIGVGLSICKLILEKMNGKIFVASIPDKGSTFIIRLPLKVPSGVNIKKIQSQSNNVVELIPKHERLHHQRDEHAEIIDKPVRVLVVEDIPVNQILLRKALDKMGMLTSLASNGREAVELIKRNHYHIILMDCQMPVMDGFEATRQIRQLESCGLAPTKHVPIIAVTANAMAGDREKCLTAGMDDYIAKPYQLSHLKNIMLNHINVAKSVHIEH